MHQFRGEPGSKRSVAPSRKLWTALQALDSYLRGQSHWLVNYADLHRAGLRVGTAITEGTANFLVNRRMNKSQQMRWSRRGADLLLQVRCAVYNGTFGSAYGRRFQPTTDLSPAMAIAACPPILSRSRHAPAKRRVPRSGLPGTPIRPPRRNPWRVGPDGFGQGGPAALLPESMISP